MTLMESPNKSKPTLSLARRPMALDAFKARIKLAEPDTSNWNAVQEAEPHNDIGVVMPGDRHVGAEQVARPVEPRLADGHVCSKPHKKFKPHPYASALPWPPRSEWFPSIEIDGEPVPDAQVRPGENPKLSARFWARRVAFEVAKNLPEDQRGAAERFVLRHRLTVLAAFSRKLRRGDVVAAMVGMFERQSRVSISG
jgi:hypothetical protein